MAATARGRSKQTLKPLTEVELELMNILWRLEGGTVNDVLAALPAERPLAYTSVSTILRILEQKEVVTSEKLGRGHRYLPRFSKQEYEGVALAHVMGKVFDGQPLALVRRLVDAELLSREDLSALQDLLGQQLHGDSKDVRSRSDDGDRRDDSEKRGRRKSTR